MAQLPPVMAGPSVNPPGMARAPVDPRKVAEFFARMPKRTQRIARSLRAIYRLFVKIGYIEHRDIKYPPHDLDGNKCLRMGMSLAAVQFLEALPWAIAGSGDMIPNSPIVDFGSTTSLLAAEHIHNATGQHPADRKNCFIALTNFGENGRGYALVLDVAKGTIRQWDGTGDFKSVPARNAVTVLREIQQRCHKLDEVPYGLEIVQPTMHLRTNPDGSQCYERDRTYVLVAGAAEECGWPSPFNLRKFQFLARRWLVTVGSEEDDLEEDGVGEE
ncbi:hypothetical protein ABEF92_002764 [Exophiala dermatitidis]|uniref:Uncharacterized protein n=1 Tax=Exophiala dermatitidis (strain ATCC 34100 / CBS 525.76 / NIH/UT8656) TaxID=858893 RepID=H6BN51_EXODN|nr:uncharacterized protein HMPREF1120_00391 [Exophiala dermatitidis NIH/UT8656]EHY52175.1 hypothetical protein HMPREF1120_00391 [Exophiala dermatitidis NIH/UT8656]